MMLARVYNSVRTAIENNKVPTDFVARRTL